MLPIKKIYIDTSKKTSTSGSTSFFKIELPETLTMPTDCVFSVDDISIPHAWRTIETNVNDKIYIQLTTTETDPNLKPNICKIVTMSPGNYNIASFALEIKTKADLAFTSVDFPTPVFGVTQDVINNTITIQPLYSALLIKILTPDDLIDGMEYMNGAWDGTWYGDPYDIKNTKDINDMLSNNIGLSAFFSIASPWTSNYIDLHPIKNIYLHSSSLSTFKTLGPNGENTIIKKIKVSSNQNQMIFDSVSSSNDVLDCSRQTLKTIDFEIKDGAGNRVPLHGVNWSFSLVFSKSTGNVE